MGQATGMFTGDECFAGKMPSQGTELCAVVEYMFSIVNLFEVFAEAALGDRLERIAFNALPATFTDDMWAHQYDQQVNQVLCKVGPECVFGTNGADANLFGLEPNFGCCTANMHQGWPKFVSHLWMRTPEGGFVAAAYAPSEVTGAVNGVPVIITLDTAYPFSETLTFRVRVEGKAAFPLLLRIPAWTNDATLVVADGSAESANAGGFHTLQREWEGETILTLRLPMPVAVERRFNNAAAVSRGPLLYSLCVDAYWRRFKGEAPCFDWEVFPTEQWNYALELNPDDPAASFTVTPSTGEPGDGQYVFTSSQPPARLGARGRLLPEWTLERGAAAPPPMSPVTSEQPSVDLELIPYGCAKLRVTEFPVI